MANPWEVPITINGVICDLYGRTITGPVKIVGSMVRSDSGVGPGPPPDGGDKPPIGGGKPTFPIAGPGPFPPKPGYPPYPAHPIELPDPPPIDPPTEPPTNPADPAWVWGYSPTVDAWLPVYVPGPGEPGPKNK